MSKLYNPETLSDNEVEDLNQEIAIHRDSFDHNISLLPEIVL